MAIMVNKTPDAGYKYILESERKDDKPFAVWIKPLATHDLLDLEDRMVQRQDERVVIAQGMFAFQVVQQSITGWENMNDPDGTAVIFKRNAGVASEDMIANIPADMIIEISNVVNAITRDPSSIQIFFPED